jgi:hypothetical protein
LTSGLFNGSHDLVPQNDRQAGWRGPAFNLIQLGVTDPADRDPYENFSMDGDGLRDIGHFQRGFVLFEAAKSV